MALRPRALRIVLLGLACALTAPSAGAAKRASASDARVGTDRREALRLFKEGRARFQQGDFQGAVPLLKAAYALSKEPVLLYDLGRAYEGMGNLKLAADSYEEYLRSADNPPDKEGIQELVKSLHRRLEDATRLERDRALALQREREQKQKLREATRPKPSSFPWIVGGVGLLTAGAAGAFGVMSQGARADADAAPSSLSTREHLDDAESYARIANVGWIAGGTLIVAGAVWLLLDIKRVRAARNAVTHPLVLSF